MHKLALKHKLTTKRYSLYIENLYPIPKMHQNSLLQNYLNYDHLFLKGFTNNILLKEFILKIIINKTLVYNLYYKTVKNIFIKYTNTKCLFLDQCKFVKKNVSV